MSQEHQHEHDFEQEHKHDHEHNHEHNHKHNHKHNHEHNHEHDHGDHDHHHSHGKTAIYLFFTGLVLFIVGKFITLPWLANVIFLSAMLTSGYHIIIEGFSDTISTTIKKKKFSPNIHILMALAAVGASLIGNFEEGALLIVIFAGAHFLEEYAESRSKREITNLLNLNPTEARLLMDDGTSELVLVTDLKIGDRLQVLVGDQIPTDGVILSGYSAIDESAINGESIPREKTVGDLVYGSTINGNGTFTMEVTKDSSDTLFAKILQLVNQSQSNISRTASFIKKFEPKYVTLILIIVPIFILISPFVFNWSWSESFYRGMVFLTVASPCALAASAVPATLSAISNLAKHGVLFKGGSYLSNLADIKAVAFDKTGTLTAGKPVVTDVYFDEEIDPLQHQEYIDILIAIERTANHPLANAMLDYFKTDATIEIETENIIGQGLIAQYQGSSYQIGKPKNDAVDKTILDHYHTYTQEGKTVVYFTKDEKVVALIAMMDIPNQQAKKVIDYLKSQGVKTIMITGDAEVTGQAVGRMIGIDEVIGNVLPENKAEIITSLQNQYGVVAMLGDGVNDAPALVKADIGVAMGEGTDIAIDVADAVLMKNDLNKFSYAYRVSKKLHSIVIQNIVFSMLVVVTLVVMNIMGTMDLPLGVIIHEGSTLVVIFNGLRCLRELQQ